MTSRLSRAAGAGGGVTARMASTLLRPHGAPPLTIPPAEPPFQHAPGGNAPSWWTSSDLLTVAVLVLLILVLVLWVLRFVFSCFAGLFCCGGGVSRCVTLAVALLLGLGAWNAGWPTTAPPPLPPTAPSSSSPAMTTIPLPPPVQNNVNGREVGLVETGASTARLLVCWTVLPRLFGASIVVVEPTSREEGGGGGGGGVLQHHDVRLLRAAVRSCEASHWCRAMSILAGCPPLDP